MSTQHYWYVYMDHQSSLSISLPLNELRDELYEQYYDIYIYVYAYVLYIYTYVFWFIDIHHWDNDNIICWCMLLYCMLATTLNDTFKAITYIYVYILI